MCLGSVFSASYCARNLGLVLCLPEMNNYDADNGERVGKGKVDLIEKLRLLLARRGPQGRVLSIPGDWELLGSAYQLINSSFHVPRVFFASSVFLE